MQNTEVLSFSKDIIQQITNQQAWHYKIVPIAIANGSFRFLTLNDKDINDKKEELELVFDKRIEFDYTSEEELSIYLNTYYRQVEKREQNQIQVSKTNRNDEDFLDNLIKEAKQLQSSDIHLEIYEERCRVRVRIDGRLIERYQLDKDTYPAIVNKIKIKSNLDIAEKRLPQDGRIFFEESGQKFDIRVSSLPTLYGEKIVMRLLRGGDARIDINSLGFQAVDLENYLFGVNRHNGIVLISGPTGSGKTTTLYATLQQLNETSRNILTIEDPIEYTLEGINQVQLKESIGLTFANAMRTFLRQDPDIIMVGEVRDLETATMAIRASLTGHLVLSTIHTNSAWGIVARLLDMGIPSFLLADTLNVAVAQRLVRLLCPHCKQQKSISPSAFAKNFKPPYELKTTYIAIGCEYCFYTGYKGRKAVYEVIPIDDQLSDKIKNQDLDIRNMLREKNIRTLSDNGYDLLAQGLTSIEEINPLLIH